MGKIVNAKAIESNVNGYSRSFPTVFEYAKNDTLRDIQGKEYIDFFCGAGALNYGHNNELFKAEIFHFLQKDAPVHFLDMDSVMKMTFLEKFQEIILAPRNLPYKVQFTGPTGTNAVEAALKLARKITGRSTIAAFTHSFHGMTATSLAASGSQQKKHALIPSQDILFLPFDGFMGKETDTMEYIERMLETVGSGPEKPAAILLETIQAEGGVNVASINWLRKLAAFARKNQIILIVDDIQVGCGRTGNFFSFERAGIVPDIVLLSKSISGFGLPLSVVLIRPDLDIWQPGEHNGTFRANNLSLCTATKALDYWKDQAFMTQTAYKAQIIENALQHIALHFSCVRSIRGIGMIRGIEFETGEQASRVARGLFRQGLIIETCGNLGQVVKLLPALTITEPNLRKGLEMIGENIQSLAENGALVAE